MFSLCSRMSSSSREKTMQEPARRVRTVVQALPVEPEAPALAVLDAVVIAQPRGVGGLAPPFAEDALGIVGGADPVQAPAPAELQRRIVGNRRDRLDRLGPREQPHRTEPRGTPGLAALLLAQGRHRFGRALRQMAVAWAIAPERAGA